MTPQEINSELELISGQIKKYAPQFAPFFEIDSTLGEYSKTLYNFPVSPIHIERQKLIRNKIEQKVKSLLGDKFNQINFSLDEKLAINIVDHHMLLSHPFLASCNLTSSINKLATDTKPAPIIVVSSSDVPPNNFFSKAGFLYHDKKVPLFSASEREGIFYYLPKREFNFIQRLKDTGRWHEFNEPEQRFLVEHQKFIDGIDFSRCQDYCDQTTMIVKEMWPLLFEPDLRKNLPELLYITQEELVTECLAELLQDDNNVVSKALFDESFRASVIENFRGIAVTWKEDQQKGTHFFWRKYPGEPRTIRMYIEGDSLIPQDDRYRELSVPLNKETVIEMLKSREIAPSLFTIFSVFSFYAGVRPLSGYGSAVYLQLMKDAWLKTLSEHQMKEEFELVNLVKTNGLVTLMACFKRVDGVVKAIYSHELIERGGLSREYLNQLTKITFQDALKTGLPDMYDYFSNKYIPSEVKIKPKIRLDDISNLIFDWV